MTKNELIDVVAASTGLTKDQTRQTIEGTIAAISEQLIAGNEVSIAGFGKFVVAERAERPGRNLQTGEAMTIAASKNVKFKVTKTLKEKL